MFAAATATIAGFGGIALADLATDLMTEIEPGSLEAGSEAWNARFAIDQAPDQIANKPPLDLDDASILTVTYKGKVAGFDVGRMFIATRLTDETYYMDYSVEQSGVARWFDSTRTDSLSYGLLEDGNMTSLYYYKYERENEENIGEYRYVEMTRPDAASRFRLWSEPEFGMRYPVPPELALPTVDPLGGLALLGYVEAEPGKEVCDRNVSVFDGRRRFNMVMEPAGTRMLRRRGSQRYEGPTWRCRVKMTKIAGYSAKAFAKGGDTEAYVYLAPVPEEAKMTNLTYLPVLIEANQGILGASLEAKAPTITLADGTVIKMGRQRRR